ncbi:MAG: nucleoside hydrolase [Acidimicrobiales bacterium]
MTLPPRAEGPLRVVIDTDTANEIDDQFALAWALLSPEQLHVEAVHAAPFCHGHYFEAIDAAAERRGGDRTPMEALASHVGPERRARMRSQRSPADGERASRDEIHRLLAVMDLPAPPPVFAGSDRFMTAPDDIVESDAAHNLIALAHGNDGPLYVPIIGAPTNVAASLLIDPTIAEKVVLVFLAGYPSAAPHADDSFNLVQDRFATNVLFESAAPLLYQPGYHVAEVLGLSLPDVETWVRGAGPLGDLLYQIYVDNPIDADVTRPGRSWVIWDIIAIAWLLDPDWAPTHETTRARVTDRHTWEPTGGWMHEAYRARRNDIFGDFVEKLARHANG